MPELDEYRISELDPVLELGQDDLMEVSVEDDNAESGYVSHKSPLSQLGAFFVNILQYVTALKTGSKTVAGAINQTVSNFADDYDNTATYDLGDCVLYNGVLYKCTTAITVAEAWDSTHWTQTKAVDAGGGNLADLDDVSINTSTLADGQVIKYDATHDIWVNADDEGAASAEDISFDDTNVAFEADDVQEAFEQITKTLTWDEYQQLSSAEKNNGTLYFISDVNARSYVDVTGTLTAGSTSITLQATEITSSSTIDIYVSTFGIQPTNAVVTTGSITLSFLAQSSDISVKVRVS